MHRLLANSEELHTERPSLSREALQHLKVLRPKDGEPIELFDGAGSIRRYRYEAATRALRADADQGIRHFDRSGTSLTLFACVTKGSRWDWTIEKATELGVTCIVPVISDRTIVRIPKSERAAKRERWLRIAEDAARQSDAVWLPEITEAVDFADTLPMVRERTCFVGALTDPPPQSLLTAATRLRQAGDAGPRSLGVYVGPEGDFTPAELAALLEIATPTSFGPTVLRAETAALFAVSVLAASTH